MSLIPRHRAFLVLRLSEVERDGVEAPAAIVIRTAVEAPKKKTTPEPTASPDMDY